MNEGKLPTLEQHAAIGGRKAAARIRSVGDDLADRELAGERLALRFEIDAGCEAFELAAARDKLWTPEKEKEGTKMNIWTPGSEETR